MPTAAIAPQPTAKITRLRGSGSHRSTRRTAKQHDGERDAAASDIADDRRGRPEGAQEVADEADQDDDQDAEQPDRRDAPATRGDSAGPDADDGGGRAGWSAGAVAGLRERRGEVAGRRRRAVRRIRQPRTSHRPACGAGAGSVEGCVSPTSARRRAATRGSPSSSVTRRSSSPELFDGAPATCRPSSTAATTCSARVRDASARPAATRHPLADVSFASAVLAPPVILAIGLNYAAHSSELGLKTDSTPTVFVLWPNSLTGHEATDVVAANAQRVGRLRSRARRHHRPAGEGRLARRRPRPRLGLHGGQRHHGPRHPVLRGPVVALQVVRRVHADRPVRRHGRRDPRPAGPAHLGGRRRAHGAGCLDRSDGAVGRHARSRTCRSPPRCCRAH